MKKLLLIILILSAGLTSNAQAKRGYMSVTYLNNVEVPKMSRFVELHKKFTEIGISKNYKATGNWLFRHWYGSGHSFVMYEHFDSMKDYLETQDNMGKNMEEKLASIKDAKEKETFEKELAEWTSYFDGHTDEMRVFNSETGFIFAPDVDFDTPLVFSVGKYNSSGDWGKTANAFVNWRIKPDVNSGAALGGGVSYHYMGSGSEIEVWQVYKSLVDFATSVTSKAPQSDAAKEASKTFWSSLDGSHEDQIYIHVGHVDVTKKVFDLAGPNR
jgi:hypothetical protein